MRARILALSAGVILIVAAVYMAFPRPALEPPVIKAPPSARQDRDAPTVSKTPSIPDTRTLSPALSDEIESAVVTYSPEALPTFEKLLASGEPDIREAARDGLVRLGEKGGSVLLRRATARLTDPEEIKKFLETADYLELPSALEGPLKNGAPKE